MDSTEDDDLKLQRASASLLSDLEKLLPKLLWKKQHGSDPAKIRSQIREMDMYRIFVLVCSSTA
jgi:hypothetical protein